MRERVHLVDCTLREGDQTAGVAMTREEKLAIARLLDAAGVALADAGMPAVHPEEAAFLRQASEQCQSMVVGASVRCREDMAELALSCGVGAVFVICPISQSHLQRRLGQSRDQLLDTLGRVADRVGSRASLELVAEDATRATEEDLLALAARARSVGAARLYLADTVGVLTPAQWLAKVRLLQEALGGDLELGVHCHNDFGMASALTLAAVEAGVRWPTACINGLGERAGNADLGAVAAATEKLLGLDSGIDLTRLPELSRVVERASGTPLSPQHPVVGANAFRHESGIHVDGVLKDPSLYEAFPPEDVGRVRTLVLGKHSGRAQLRAVLRESGLQLDEDSLAVLRKRLQAEAMTQDRAGFDRLLERAARYREQQQGVPVEQVLTWARALGARA